MSRRGPPPKSSGRRHVVADHPAIVDLVGDLATNTRRRRRRLLLCTQAALAVVLMEVILLILVIVGEGGGRRGWHPVPIPVGVAEVADAPVRVKFPPEEGVPVGGRDGEVAVPPQGLRKEGTPPAYLPHALWPIKRDRRNGHAVVIQVPPRRQLDIRPQDRPVTRVELAGRAHRHVHAVVRGMDVLRRG
jgi:hypothetical protein